MIFDTLENASLYFGVNADFEKAFNFIKKATEENFDPGEYEIEGRKVYAVIMQYDTQHRDKCRFEAHRKYIDIQYVASGREIMEVSGLSGAEIDAKYNADSDVEFFKDCDSIKVAGVKEKEFGIFFPQDVHMPKRMYGGYPCKVKKIIVKLEIQG